MIDRKLLERYRRNFGDTFTVATWDKRPGETVNTMLRAALDGRGPILSDQLIADELATRVPPEES